MPASDPVEESSPVVSAKRQRAAAAGVHSERIRGCTPELGAGGSMTDIQDNRPDDDDVEGHRSKKADAETSDVDDVEGHRSKKADAETSDDDDVEGHRSKK